MWVGWRQLSTESAGIGEIRLLLTGLSSVQCICGLWRHHLLTSAHGSVWWWNCYGNIWFLLNVPTFPSYSRLRGSPGMDFLMTLSLCYSVYCPVWHLPVYLFCNIWLIENIVLKVTLSTVSCYWRTFQEVSVEICQRGDGDVLSASDGWCYYSLRSRSSCRCLCQDVPNWCEELLFLYSSLSTSHHCCVNYTGWRYHSGFSSDCVYSHIGVYTALLRPTCPIVYAVLPTSTHVDAYAQPTRQHCWSRRHDALPLVIERFRLLRHAPGMPFLWLFMARQHCLRSAGSLGLTCIAVLLTSSNGVRIRLQSTFAFVYWLIFVRCSRSVFNVWRHLNLIDIYIALHNCSLCSSLQRKLLKVKKGAYGEIKMYIKYKKLVN